MHKSLITLPNGLKVLSINNPAAESVALSLVGRAGTLYETPDSIGAAHFLEHVVFDATRDYPSELSLTGLIEDVGGYRGGMTNKEIVEYWVKVLPAHIEQAFIYLSQITLHPLIREKDIEKHKGIIEQEINRDKANPERYAPQTAFNILFPFQPIGALTTGEVSDIMKINRNTLESFMRQHYIAQNFILVVAGKIDESQIKDLAQKYFSEMRSGEVQRVALQPNYQRDMIIKRKPELEQTTLRIIYHGFNKHEHNRVAAEFISALLSDGKTSRLRTRIRDELGLAYVIGSYHHTGIQYGLFSIYSGLAQKNIPEFMQAIKDECEKLVDYDIPQAEWKKTIIGMEAEFTFDFENPTQIARYYARNHIDETEITDHTQLVQEYKDLKPEDVRAAARELFSQEPKIVAIGGNISKELFEQ